MSIRVLIVDDSAFMRKMLTEIIAADPRLEVVGTARNGEEAVEQVLQLKPDVVTMDVEMPIMSGDEALRQIMAKSPRPVVMLSSLTQQGAAISIQCMADGAVDVIGKPSGSTSLDIQKISGEITAKIRHAAGANVSALTQTPTRSSAVVMSARHNVDCILIGSSTGGPKALQVLLPDIPANIGVPIVVVQHMPAHFTRTLAERLDSICPLAVKEAAAGDRLQAGRILIAPGGVHLKFDAAGTAVLSEEPPVHGVRPSVDITISSLAARFGAKLCCVLLTGMGRDGAAGLKGIRDLGGHTIAEHESTCVVYGMPRAAVEMKAAEQVLPLGDIASAIVSIANGTSVRKTA